MKKAFLFFIVAIAYFGCSKNHDQKTGDACFTLET
jgi:hypothetical protein